MGELDFENVVFGYGGNTLFNGLSAIFREGADQLHRWTERVRKINHSRNSPWGL